ncbi:MAG: FtsW/RodA/SpoVE family cell cycle protein, partial [Pseudomonadota bacterium]
MLTPAQTAPIYKKASFISQWWKAVDRGIILCVFALCFVGLVLIASSGPSVARRIGISDGILPAEWWFFGKYLVFLLLSIVIMLSISFLSIKTIRRIGVILCAVSFILLLITPIFGTEIKGARRWILGIQPSEFMKPGFVIFCAWMMDLAKTRHEFPGMMISLGALILTLTLFLIQPDFGQTILLSAVWMAMLFATGAHILWFIGLGTISSLGLIVGYYTLGHVRARVDAFLSPDAFDKFGVNYQSEIARKAFASGGFLGRGPGEGEVKQSLPDAHTDYIFAVAGEELGLIVCCFIIAIYMFIIFYAMVRVAVIHDHFSRFAVVGLVTLFGLQAFI